MRACDTVCGTRVERRRFGYRRLHQMLSERDGMNLKKLRRLYREERLQVRQRKGRKRVAVPRVPMTIPQGPNQRWSMDFVSDVFAASRRFRIFAAVDDFTANASVRWRILPSQGSVWPVSWTPSSPFRKAPALMSATNGPEFTSMAVLQWHKTAARLALYRLWQAAANPFAESFNGKLRDEFLNETVFSSPDRSPYPAG